MFISMDKAEILKLQEDSLVEYISLFSSIENAQLCYSDKPALYTGYIESKENLTYAFATPVKIFKIKGLPEGYMINQ